MTDTTHPATVLTDEETEHLQSLVAAAVDAPHLAATALTELITQISRRHTAAALRTAANDLGSSPTMRVLVERESCDWWTEKPVSAWLRERAARYET